MVSTHVPTLEESADRKDYNVHVAQKLLQEHILSKLVGLSKIATLTRVTLNLVQEGVKLNNPLHCTCFRQLKDDLINFPVLREMVCNALQVAIQRERLPFGCLISIEKREIIITLVRLATETGKVGGEG